jgi:cell pole-organizing protein PopZ
MSQPVKVPEPSIDEILASIRRSIVPEDDAGKPAARKPGSRKVASAPLGASVPASAKGRRAEGEAARAGSDAAASEGPEQAPGKGVDRRSDDGRASLEGQTSEGDRNGSDATNAPADAAATGTSATAPGEATEAGLPAPDAPLLSPRATAAVDTAFNSLANTVLLQNPRTLEDLVRDMLRPMLKSWLDANLPDLVERMVRAEIERLSRRG